MRARTIGLLAAGLSFVAACTTSPDDVDRVLVRYQTGSIPPPYNHTWEIEAEKGGSLRFRLTHRYRSEEMPIDPDAPEDVELDERLDSAWEARIFGAARTLKRPWFYFYEQQKIGADLLEATYGGRWGEVTGWPTNRGEWDEIAEELTAIADPVELDTAPES